jgi:hypothetical protein
MVVTSISSRLHGSVAGTNPLPLSRNVPQEIDAAMGVERGTIVAAEGTAVMPFQSSYPLSPRAIPTAGCPTGDVRAARVEDLEKRTRRMARKTLQPTLGVSFFPSSMDLGL